MTGRPFASVFVATLLVLLGAPAANVTAQTPVALELITESGFPIEGHAVWLEFLKTLGFTNVLIRGARPGEEPLVVNRGTDESPRYAVVGVLTGDNQLRLPGLAVRRGQRQQLVDWLARLREGGEDAITGAAGAFGLTARQFVVLYDAVKPAVAFPTKGRLVRDVVQQIIDSTPVAVDMDPGARSLVAGPEQVLDELQGLSRGTALAAALRPLGLVVVVTGQGKRAGGLRVAVPTGKEETWPVGIPRPRTQPPEKLAPTLFKFITVEINDRPLSEALAALQERIQIPVLLDHNALAKHAVDLETKVSLPSKKTFYKKIIDELVHKAMLRSELRVDDADRPFLWITTIKK